MASDVVICPQCGAKNRVPTASSGKPACGKCQADLPWLVDATDAEFDAAVDTSRLVVVDLWAPWCGPCKVIAPILEKLSVEFAGRLKVVKVDVDRSPATAQRFGASSIPMLLFMRGGEVIDRAVGAQPEPVLREVVNTLLGSASA